MTRRSGPVLFAISLCGLLAVGCAKKVVKTMPSAAAPTEATGVGTAASPSTTGSASTASAGAGLGTVYFDYDSARLLPSAIDELASNGDHLLAQPALGVRLEGHCDERGTQEYNLALGDRRARAARDYLVTFGVAPDRLESISFGEERPADQRHEEAGWRFNRRVEFSPK